MNFLKTTRHSIRFAQKRGLVKLQLTEGLRTTSLRPYSSTSPVHAHHVAKKESSNIPWVIGSLVVFGPLLFKLTSPPPPKKKNLQSNEHHNVPAVTPPVITPKEEEDKEESKTGDKKVEEIKPVTVKEVQKPYVLVGAGTASFAAAQAIKEKDPNANVIIIGNEGYAPYMRPPLSKELWFSNDPEVGTKLLFKDWSGTERNAIYQDISEYEVIQDASGSDLETPKIKLLLNKTVTKLNVEDHTVTLDDGSMIYYNKVLLATGGEPKKLSIQTNSKHITTFRNVYDFQKLDKIAKDGAHIAVVGGGFLGSELAVALAHRSTKENLKVTQIFPEDGNMAKVFPGYLTKWTTSRVRKLGVDVKERSRVESIAITDDDKTSVKLSNGESLLVDHVIVAIGIEPRVDLARDAGLEIDEERLGVVVNAELEARKDVYIAGDMVSFHDVQLGRRRIEHHDHAVLSGRHAGENMVTNKGRAYDHQSMFWSDLGPEIGYEAVGLINSQLSTVSIWAKASANDTPAAAAASAATTTAESVTEEVSKATANKQENPFKDEKFGKGLVFYVRDQKIVGLVLFNVFGKVQEARNIINGGYTTDKIDSLVKQFDLYSKDP
ncbi:apoptosis-inducing factor, mitochondrion-associated, C-term-domain-containing protein [Cokeromyces recurvatus]|uniref:apoptosis-inducing factor, mitochondrion-associated, C-term-domain-containing protein n=1 Tax=Cokeromyces recurvatus TaxID=90255 RepID=UPI00221F3881|nr:apoptosis-inducing factor, mitochondrion-associated, C-term-domain-containing protein [Cokeromyces recurvatus]KAI7901681.1 apoptosis-inducing factor, mitochondrion-associated, C-term-domain-containing protein [Cokeromyces recurvatus]